MTPKLYFLSSRPSKGTSLRRNTRFEPSLVVISPTVWSGSDAESTKKERTKSKPKIRHFHRPPSHHPTLTKFCTQGHIPNIFLGFEFQKDRLKNVGAVGVKFLAFPLTWHIAYTTACSIAQAVI